MIDKLTRDDLPNGWAMSKLVDIAIINMGQSPPSDTYNHSGQGLPFFQGKAEFGEMYPTIDKYCSKPIKIAKKDEILISVRAPIGPTNIASEECCIGRGLASIRTLGGISQRYVLYYLRLIEIDLIKLGTGSTFKSISKNDLENIPIPIPPLSTQMAIVERIEELFSELDNSTLKLNELLTQLDVYRQSFFKWSFSDKKIFRNQEYVALKTICGIMGGVTKGRNLIGKETIDLPYLRVANVQDGYLNLSEVKKISVLPSDKQKYKLIYGDILYTEGGDRDKLGRGTIWREEIKDCIHQNHVFRARLVSKDFEPRYIAYFSQTKAAKEYFYKNGKQTTNLASINISILSSLPIPFCSLEDQLKIVENIDLHISIYHNAKAKVLEAISEAALMKKTLLAKAYSGELADINTGEAHGGDLIKKIKLEKLAHEQYIQHNPKQQKTKIKMSKQEKSIIQVLNDASAPMSAKAVWEQSMYKGNIELFYAELKKVQHLIVESEKGFLLLNQENIEA